MQTAQRELTEECGSGLQVNFLSSAPAAHLTYEHGQGEEIKGSKVSYSVILGKSPTMYYFVGVFLQG